MKTRNEGLKAHLTLNTVNTWKFSQVHSSKSSQHWSCNCAPWEIANFAFSPALCIRDTDVLKWKRMKSAHLPTWAVDPQLWICPDWPGIHTTISLAASTCLINHWWSHAQKLANLIKRHSNKEIPSVEHDLLWWRQEIAFPFLAICIDVHIFIPYFDMSSHFTPYIVPQIFPVTMWRHHTKVIAFRNLTMYFNCDFLKHKTRKLLDQAVGYLDFMQ